MSEQLYFSLITGVLIGGVGGYLGSLMVSKKMALIAGPLGHLTLPGIALALLYGFDVSLGALPFVVLGAVLIWLLRIRTRLPEEALTAVVFATGVSIAFMILPSEELETALIGDISQVGFEETIISSVLCLLVFLILRKIYYKFIFTLVSEDLAEAEGINVNKYNFIFLACIAVVVVLGVKIVGGILTAALVAIPACTARNLSNNLTQYSYGAVLAGGLSSVTGILLSESINLPAGPLVILCSALFFVISVIFKR